MSEPIGSASYDVSRSRAQRSRLFGYRRALGHAAAHKCAIAAARERLTREGESSLRGTAMRLGQA